MKQTHLLMFGHAGNQDPTLLGTIDVGPTIILKARSNVIGSGCAAIKGGKQGLMCPCKLLK
jgi:hypothetical protein